MHSAKFSARQECIITIGNLLKSSYLEIISYSQMGKKWPACPASGSREMWSVGRRSLCGGKTRL